MGTGEMGGRRNRSANSRYALKSELKSLKVQHRVFEYFKPSIVNAYERNRKPGGLVSQLSVRVVCTHFLMIAI